jgi:hypothetical protein
MATGEADRAASATVAVVAILAVAWSAVSVRETVTGKGPSSP